MSCLCSEPYHKKKVKISNVIDSLIWIIFFIGLGEVPIAPPPVLSWAGVPCRAKLMPVENHCFIMIKGPTLFVLHPSYHSPLYSFIPVMLPAWLFLEHIRQAATSGLLHLMTTLSVMFSLQICTWHLTSLYICLIYCLMSAFPTRITSMKAKMFLCVLFTALSLPGQCLAYRRCSISIY